MKKTLVSALASALVIGAASTTFAAANPFADVPADHWAYDAIAQLSAEGVIDGYGDGTYRGDQEITRYEVAQVVARAMAKQDVNAATKAMIDKLAAEFSAELQNLGVRVSALEKKVDNVKFAGELRYRTGKKWNDGAARVADKDEILFRLEPTATVNNHWVVKSRIDVGADSSKNMKTSANSSKASVDRAWAEGKYGKTTIKLGKLPYKSMADDAFTTDVRLSGAEVTVGNKLKVDLMAGRLGGNYTGIRNADTATGASIWSVQVFNDRASKITAGVGYTQVTSKTVLTDAKDDEAKIINIGLGYKFDKNLKISGAYTHNSEAVIQKSGHNIQLNYKGADKAKAGSYGIYAGYRYLGLGSVVHSTYSENGNWLYSGEKFWEVGAQYTVEKNIMATVRYADGKNIASGADFKSILGQVDFYF